MGSLRRPFEEALLAWVHPDLESLDLGHRHGITMAVRPSPVKTLRPLGTRLGRQVQGEQLSSSRVRELVTASDKTLGL